MKVSVRGAGVLGLWQALTLARAGFDVDLRDAQAVPFHNAASSYAGAWLAPDCEAQTAPAVVRTLGHESLADWVQTYPNTQIRGTLVIAAPRDRRDLDVFAARAVGHRRLTPDELGQLEPDLADHASAALLFAAEGHVAPLDVLAFLLAAVEDAGVKVRFGTDQPDASAAITIDCRGLAAQDTLPDLRGVRGERVVVWQPDLKISRPIYLLHPRQPLYVVPWGDGRYMAGATMIEREDGGGASVRSVLELLGALYAVHPAFAEAEVQDVGAGVRPAFPSNVPEVVIRDDGRSIYVNGAYRHGFLLAPALARAVRGIIVDGDLSHPLIRVG